MTTRIALVRTYPTPDKMAERLSQFLNDGWTLIYVDRNMVYYTAGTSYPMRGCELTFMKQGDGPHVFETDVESDNGIRWEKKVQS